MITHCPHCHFEFLLEDVEMPAGGISLQCASCKQVFGVLASSAQASPPQADPASPARPAPGPGMRKMPSDGFAGADDVTPAPGLAPLPPWRLKRENGDIVPVENLNIVKQWIVDRLVRRDDLLTQDGVSWQRLANMRELIPSFEHVSRPEATRLIERHAFVVNLERATDLASSEPTSPDARLPLAPMEAAETWPGANPPLVVEEPSRRASKSYQHDKAHPFDIPMNHVHRDYPALWRRQQWVRWSLGTLVAMTASLGLVLWVAPHWVHRATTLVHPAAVPEAAVTLVHEGYGQLYPDSVASLQTAAQTFKRAIAIDAQYAEAHAGLAEAQLTLAESYRQQAQDGSRVTDKKRTRAGHAAQAAQAAELEKEAAGYLQAGMMEAETALRLAPESTAANRAMALYYEVAGTDLERAAPYLRRVRAAAPDDVRVMYVDLNSGHVAPQQAIETYRSIVQRMPQFNRARYKLARLYMQENDLEHASEQVAAIVASAPGHHLARWLLGDAPEAKPSTSAVVSNLPTLEHADAATFAARPAADMPPGASYEALIHQGQLLRATHQLPAAMALYGRAIASDRRRAAAYIGMGWCQLDQEQSGPAMLTFTHATELSPWAVEAHYGLAEALRAEGDIQQAIKHYRQVLVIEPDGAMGRLARQVLDEISR